MKINDPYGGMLVHRILEGEQREEWLEKAKSLPTIVASPMILSDLICIATGVFSPLTGFLNESDYYSVCEKMRLKNGIIWTIPVTLSIPENMEKTLYSSKHLAILDPNGSIVAVVRIEDLYHVCKKSEAKMVFNTTEETHPGVNRLINSSSVYIGGEILLVNLPKYIEPFSDYLLEPTQTRCYFKKNNWKQIVGFQTRNPVHRAHEYIQKAALETADGLFFNPLVGETKEDEIPVDIKMESYKVMLKEYFPEDRVLFGIYPAAMRYAGPREAVLHAIARKNYGCTHFIVGRDHAGVGNYYGVYDAQIIFGQFDSKELGIQPLFFEHCFYCSKCNNMASCKSCPHSSDYHINLSGTKVRVMLQNGEMLSPLVSRPEVVKVLIDGLAKKNNSSK